MTEKGAGRRAKGLIAGTIFLMLSCQLGGFALPARAEDKAAEPAKKDAETAKKDAEPAKKDGETAKEDAPAAAGEASSAGETVIRGAKDGSTGLEAVTLPREKHSLLLSNLVVEQGEQETFMAISRKDLDNFVKEVTSAADSYLSKQKRFETRKLIIHCTAKPDGRQSFSLTSKPGLSGPITSGLDQVLRKVPVLPVRESLTMELICNIFDEQTAAAYKAQALNQAGKTAEAVALLEPEAKDDCKNAFVWRVMGWAYNSKGDYVNAERALKKAIELDPRDFDSWSNLVSTYHSEGKVKESEEAAKRNLDCATDENTTAIVNINSALYTGQWATAEPILRGLCDRTEEGGDAYRAILAYVLRWQGKNAEAKQLLEKALKPHADKRFNLDDYYSKFAQKQLAILTGDWKTAEELGKLDLTKDPKDYESLYDMGIALKGEGKLDEARKAFEAAVQPVTPKSILEAVNLQIKELSGITSNTTNSTTK